MRLATLLRLEILAPAVLVLAGLADLGLRFLPRDYFSFRSWEALRVGGEAGPFRPNRRYATSRAYGDLANLGNLPALREYHAQAVTTDAWGFRNPPALAESGRVRVILTGSSLTAGTEVADSQTLAARLSDRLGTGVYNAALAEPDLSTLRGLARRLGVARGVLIFELLEDRDAPGPALGGDEPRAGRCPRAIARMTATCRAYNWAVDQARVSPLRILSRRSLRRVQNDRWLPNPDRDDVLRARLENGREMLFQGADAEWQPSLAAEDRAVRYFSWLERRLAREGIDLLVILAPRKYTVYGPLLSAAPSDVDVGARSLERIARRLADRRVPVVNLTPALRSAARAALAQGRYIYFRDDTHWNADGIVVVADAVAPRLAELGRERRP